MPDTSARLSLPFVQAAQAQKHVTVNEGLQRLDLLVQLTLQAVAANTPPGLPQDGQIWALGAAPTGAWVGQAGRLAAWIDGGWLFTTPQPGWLGVREDDGAVHVWSGSAWITPPLPDLALLPGVGVNTFADATNRLAVSAPASLFTHEGAGHQLKVNKAAPGDTASLLFQTGWSGRAEMGTTGSDDFAVKVSADGAVWADALVMAAASGAVDAPQGLTVAGQAAIHRGNMLGAVGQAAGQPTGAVLERGSAANGQFLRLACGTLICWHTLDLGDPTATGAGSFADPHATVAAVWTYPSAFVAGPVVTGTARCGGTAADRRMVLTTGTPGTGAVADVVAFRASGGAGTDAVSVDLLAVGRWV